MLDDGQAAVIRRHFARGPAELARPEPPLLVVLLEEHYHVHFVFELLPVPERVPAK